MTAERKAMASPRKRSAGGFSGNVEPESSIFGL